MNETLYEAAMPSRETKLLELTGKRAVITGAASGIGLAVARLFAAQGAETVLVDLDSG